MNKTYNCDYCPARFDNEKDCMEHEKVHPAMDSLKVKEMSYEDVISLIGAGTMPNRITLTQKDGHTAFYVRVGNG